MKRFTLCASLLVAGLAAATPAWAADSAFCADLKAVVGDSANHFDTFRGAQFGNVERDSVNDVTTKYTTSKSLTGAADCWIEDFIGPQDDKPLRSYNCEWTPAGSKADTVKTVGQAVEDCIGGDPMDSLDVNDDGSAEAYVYGNGYKVNVGSGDAPNIRFTIYDEH